MAGLRLPAMGYNVGIHSSLLQDYSLLSALVVLVWDCIICFNDETLLIWSRRWTPVKCAYLFSRYFGIAIQLSNYVVFRSKISRVPVPSEICARWYAFQMATSWSLYSAYDLVIMFRVYALHRQSSRMGAFLVTLYVSEAILAAFAACSVLRSVVFDARCDATNVTKVGVIFAGGVMIVQSIIWSLTFRQPNTGGTEIPIVEVVLRDKKWIWCIVCAAYAAIPVSFARQKMTAHIIVFWPMTLISVATCRLVLNMQGTPLFSSQQQTSNPDIQHPLPVERELETSSIVYTRPVMTSQALLSHTSALSALTIPTSYPASTASRRVGCVEGFENDGSRISIGTANLSIDIGSYHPGSSIDC